MNDTCSVVESDEPRNGVTKAIGQCTRQQNRPVDI